MVVKIITRTGITMRAETIAYMIYVEGPEYPEYAYFYLKSSGTPKYGNMLGNPLPAGPAEQTTEITKNIRVVQNKGVSYAYFSQKVFPGMLQVIISNGTGL